MWYADNMWKILKNKVFSFACEDAGSKVVKRKLLLLLNGWKKNVKNELKTIVYSDLGTL